MKIHEYQAKSVLARFGVPVPRGEAAFSAAEVGKSARRLGGSMMVVKAQIHAGGRGKGGGVKLARSPEEAEQIAKRMIGMTLVTHQTGPEGRKVGRVLIEEGLQIERELYLSIVIDRAAACPVIIASAAGTPAVERRRACAVRTVHLVRTQIPRALRDAPIDGCSPAVVASCRRHPVACVDRPRAPRRPRGHADWATQDVLHEAVANVVVAP